MNPLPPLPRDDLEDVFRQVGEIWEKLRGQNIFISGASGFFGSWLLETLLFAANRLDLGAKVWTLTRDMDRFRFRLPHLANHPAVELVGGGVEEFVFPQKKMAYVIHSMVPEPGMPLPEMEKWFEMGTLRLLELALRDRSEGFLLCSTGAVYQPQNRPLREEDPLIPLDAPLSYGRIRRQVEDQCLAACEKQGIPLKIARGFAFAGPRLPENAGFALADFLRDAREGRPIKIKGTGSPVRSYMHAKDMTLWLWKIILSVSEKGIFNLGSEEGVRIADLAAQISYMVKTKVEKTAPSPLPNDQKLFYVPSALKALKTFDLPTPTNLRKTLIEALAKGPKRRHLI